MSHWFDRFATWSVGDEKGGEELQLTRRQAVRAAAGAAAGVGAAGLLGGPLARQASAIGGGTSPQCQCWDRAIHTNNVANRLILRNLGGTVVTPAGGIVVTVGLITAAAAMVGQAVHCGLCKDD